mmetsp:Transcript_106063/g.253156  ORF Transcript_106063/g.253156 Transcript_106063/m.253156 type:complete len:248 (-) Transcript_106063:442-1185(-)
MRLEGGAPARRLVPEEVLQRLTHPDHGQRLPRPCESFGAGDDVRDDAFKVLEGKEFAGAPEASHHLIANHQDVVLVAQRADTFHEAHSRDEHPRTARHAFQHDGSDGGRTFRHDLLFEAGQGHVAGLLIGVSPPEEVRLRIEHLHIARGEVPGEAAPEVPGGAQRPQRPPVIRAVLVEDLGLACVEPRQADGAVIGLSTARREEEAVDIPRRQLRQQRRQARTHRHHAHATVDKGSLLHLLDHGLLH